MTIPVGKTCFRRGRLVAAIAAAAFLAFIGGGAPGAETASDAQPPTLNVAVDARVELLAVVQLLSDYQKRFGLINDYDTSYRRDVEAHFGGAREHRAVNLFREMSAKGFSYDAPPAAMLHLSDPPALEVKTPFTGYLERRAGGKEKLEEFVSALRDFASKTDFVAFFKAHADTYAQAVAGVRENIAGTNYPAALEEYYGMRQHSYNIVLAPLFRGSYGSRIERDDGTCDIYSIQEAMGMRGDIPYFGDRDQIGRLVWHEFGHSFANPLGEKHRDELMKYKALFEPIRNAMKKQAYGDWLTCVNEHVVRAAHIRIAALNLGDSAAAALFAQDRSRRFDYVGALCDRLKEYEAHRDRYPTLEAFYPRMVDVFRELAAKDLPASSYSPPLTNINAAVMDRQNMVIIVSTGEEDKAAQQRIRRYAETLRDMFFAERPVITDTEALAQDLTGKSLVVYGTLDGNLFLRPIAAELPFKVEADCVTAGSTWRGGNLRLIALWRNPQDSTKGMVIYTAQQARHIPDINSVFHGPTDFVVARDAKVLRAGSYDKSGEEWTIPSP